MPTFRKFERLSLALGLVCTFLIVGGCVADTPPRHSMIHATALEEMEALALCRQDDQGVTIESKIKAEYGFKRFAENTFRPVVERRLFGHEVRVVEFTNSGNKIYAAGNPLEFGHHFKWLLSDLTCVDNTCQAPLDDGQSLLIYKVQLKKSKDTAVIECTKPITSKTTE